MLEEIHHETKTDKQSEQGPAHKTHREFESVSFGDYPAVLVNWLIRRGARTLAISLLRQRTGSAVVA